MRYSKEHMAQTRTRILDTAARLFREHGVDGVGIDAIMEAAGLTRGGFYGHFDSKEDLFEEVLRRKADFVVRLRARMGETREELTEEALEVVGGYLAPENRQGGARGCLMASLSVDVARSSKDARKGFADVFRDLEREFARGLTRAKDPDPRAMASIALCVGGVILSRAIGDGELADRLSKACEDAVARELSR
jgi:TetR/AcrR family transcriptional repressor of nem operon